MNKELLKNRKFQIGAGILIFVVLIIGLLLFKNLSVQNQPVSNPNILPSETPALKISAQEIGLTLTASEDMHKATMKITKTTDITSLDYQLSYNATVNGDQIPRGTIGHVDITNSGKSVSQDMIFGTCSDVCHYDTGITDVSLIVKIVKTDGKVYQAQIGLQ